jgi:hypothetical protein
VVACLLGRLYNKERVIEFLLNRKAFGEGEVTTAHINSMKVCEGIIGVQLFGIALGALLTTLCRTLLP